MMTVLATVLPALALVAVVLLLLLAVAVAMTRPGARSTAHLTGVAMAYSSFARCTVRAARLRQGMWLVQDLPQDLTFGKRASGERLRVCALTRMMAMRPRSAARAPALAGALGAARRLTTSLRRNCNRAFAPLP